jgi:Tfp pilus assembly protein PilF
MRAIEEYEALARQPEHRKAAVLEMGLILLETRQKGKAIQVTRDALAEHPDDPALSERLVVLEMMWDHHQAEKLCEAWQRREPGSLRPVWLLARIASSQSDLPRAEQWLQQCLGREPDNPDYVVSMAEVLLRDRRRASLERARELLERAAARPAADVGTVLDLAQTLQQLGQPEAARRQYLRALDLDPNNSAPYVSLVQLARPLGQPEPISLWGSLVRAVEEREREETLLARRTWETPADPAGHEQLALYEVRNDELRKAEAQLEEALRLRPGWAEAARELAAVRRAREALQ